METIQANEVKNIKFDSNIANKKCYTVVNYSDGGEKKESIGVLTGRYGDDSVYNGQVFESLYNGAIVWFANITGGLYVVADKTEEMRNKAQNYLDELLKNDNNIATDLLIASLFVEKLEAKGYVVTYYRMQITALYERLTARNKKVVDSGYIQDIQTENIQQIDNSLSNSISGCRIGLVLTTGLIISITAVVIGVMASMAWYIFYNLDMESRSDVSKSKELNKILAKVDPETKEQIFQFVNEYGDKRYKDGVRRIKMDLLWNNVKKYGLIAGGVALFLYINNKGLLKNNKTKTK